MELSPIFYIRWLRIIVDEGHVLGQNSSNQSSTLNRLSVERKWCSSGTPIPTGAVMKELKNLFGLLNFIQLAPYNMDKFWNKFISKPLLSSDLNEREIGIYSFFGRFFLLHSNFQKREKEAS